MANRLSTYLDAQLATGASFDFRSTNIQKSLTDVGKQKEALELRMAAVAARYLKQFTALDSMLTNMQQTSSYLHAAARQPAGRGQLIDAWARVQRLASSYARSRAGSSRIFRRFQLKGARHFRDVISCG